MVWSLDMDDFSGACGRPYPLLSAIKTALKHSDKDIYYLTEPQSARPIPPPPHYNPSQNVQSDYTERPFFNLSQYAGKVDYLSAPKHINDMINTTRKKATNARGIKKHNIFRGMN